MSVLYLERLQALAGVMLVQAADFAISVFVQSSSFAMLSKRWYVLALMCFFLNIVFHIFIINCAFHDALQQFTPGILSVKGLGAFMHLLAKECVLSIKFVEVQSSLDSDVSFDAANGPVAAGFVTYYPSFQPNTLHS